MNKEKPEKRLSSYAKYSGLAIQMIAIIFIGVYIGTILDEKFPNEKDFYTLGCTLSSVVLSTIYVIRRIITISKDNK